MLELFFVADNNFELKFALKWLLFKKMLDIEENKIANLLCSECV